MVVLQGPILISSLLSMMLASFGAARAEAEAPVSGESVQELAYVGSTMWGGANDFVVKDGVAYIAMRNGVRILDVIDPTNMILVSEHYLNEQALAVDVEGDLLYVNCELSGTLIFDVSDPSHLVEVGSYPPGCWWGRALEVEGQHAYLGCQFGMQILDVSDPTHPEFISNFHIPSDSGAWPQNITILNDTAYISAGYLWIVDVSDKENPVEVVKYSYDDWHYYVQDVERCDSLLFLANSSNIEPAIWSAVTVLNFSEPESPIALSDRKLVGNHVYTADLYDKYLIVGTYRSGIVFFDASNPMSLSPSTCVPVYGGAVRDVQISDTLLFAMNQAYTFEYPSPLVVCDSSIVANSIPSSLQKGDFAILDIADPIAPRLLGRFPFAGHASEITLMGNLAAVCDDGAGTLTLVDITDREHMTVLSLIELPGQCINAAFADTLLVVAGGTAGVLVLSVADPTQPHIIGVYDSLQKAHHVIVRDNTAFAINQGDGLYILDITDPAHPEQIGSYHPPGNALTIALLGNYAYVTDIGGLQIVDVSNPVNPVWKAKYRDTTDSRRIANVAAFGNTLYLEGDQVVEILDATDPEHLTRHARFVPPLTAHGIYDMSVSGPYLSLARVYDGVQVLDVSDIESPTVAYTYDTPGGALGVSLLGRDLFVADQYGLVSLRIPVSTHVGGGYDDVSVLPELLQLHQNYPNPFNPSTTISFSLSQEAVVSLTVYNILGQAVKTLMLRGKLSAGPHSAVWDGTNSHGDAVSSGIYLYRLSSDKASVSRKMLLLR